MTVQSSRIYGLFDPRNRPAIKAGVAAEAQRLLEQGADWEQLLQNLGPAFQSRLDEASQAFANAIVEHAADPVADAIGAEAGFEARLGYRFGRAFEFYRIVRGACLEAGEEFFAYHRRRAGREQMAKLEALTRLHARACLVAGEVFALLRSGYGDGARARWRTLHELAVISSILAGEGPEVSARYLDHGEWERWRDAKDYQLFAGRIGHQPFSDKEMAAIVARKDKVVSRYPREFARDHGWAHHLLKRPTMRGLEELAHLDHLRPYYNLGSHSVHAGPRAGALNIFASGGRRYRRVGPSNGDVAEPAHGALISLMQVTISLLLRGTSKPPEMALLVAKALMTLVDEAGRLFSESASAVQRLDSEPDSKPPQRR